MTTVTLVSLAADGKKLRFTVPAAWPADTQIERVVKIFAKRCGSDASELMLIREGRIPVPQSTKISELDDVCLLVRRRIHCVVITLARDERRVRHVKTEVLPKIEAEVVDAIDGTEREDLEQCLHEYGILLQEKYARSCTVGQLGCACSHLKQWQRFAREERGFFLVLEDDVVLADNFLAKLDRLVLTEDTFDLLYLFHHADCRPPNLVNLSTSHPKLVPGFPTWGTVAYVVTSHGARKLLSRLSHTTHDRPIDEMIMALVRERSFLLTFVAFPSIAATAGTLNPIQPPAALGSNVWQSPKFLSPPLA